MDVREYEGGSEGVECVPVPGAGHRTCGPERFDEQLAAVEAEGDLGPGPVLARASVEHGGPDHARAGEGGTARPWGRRGGDTVNDVYYPNPARGLDRKAAIARLHASPEVLPPKVEARAPRMMWRNRNAEFLKMRPLPLIGVLCAGFALPLFLRAAIGR